MMRNKLEMARQESLQDLERHELIRGPPAQRLSAGPGTESCWVEKLVDYSSIKTVETRLLRSHQDQAPGP